MRQMYLGGGIKYLFGVIMHVRLVISFILAEFVLKDLKPKRLLFMELNEKKYFV